MIYSFQVHVLIENGIAFTCVTYLTRKHYLPFAFLEALKGKFLEVPSLRSRAVTASENEFERDFCPVVSSVVVSTDIQSQSHFTTDSQSVSLSWCRAPSGANDLKYRHCFDTTLHIITTNKGTDWRHTKALRLLSARIWIEVFELFLCLMVLYSPIAVYHMSMWALLCTCIVVVCFLWIAWIYGPKARTFLAVLNLSSDALF
jgi:hypothetical protein